jgi:hypothetical protein
MYLPAVNMEGMKARGSVLLENASNWFSKNPAHIKTDEFRMLSFWKSLARYKFGVRSINHGFSLPLAHLSQETISAEELAPHSFY